MDPDRAQLAPDLREHPDRRVGDRRREDVHLHPRRYAAPAQILNRCIDGSPTTRGTWGAVAMGTGFRHDACSSAAPAPTSAARTGLLGSLEGKGPAREAALRPSTARSACHHRGAQRRDVLARAAHRRERRVVPRLRHRGGPGTTIFGVSASCSRACTTPLGAARRIVFSTRRASPRTKVKGVIPGGSDADPARPPARRADGRHLRDARRCSAPAA
jgi:hypothetical protein